MATPEKKVKERARKVLNELGAYYFFPSSAYGGRNGVPDIIGCYEGLFFGIECKAGKNKPTKLQLKELGKIELAGGLPLVFTDSMKPTELKTILIKAALEGAIRELKTDGKDSAYWTHWALQNIS